MKHQKKRRLHALATEFGLLLSLWLSAVPLLAQFAPVSPQVYSYAPVRVLGTNLMDFAPMINAALAGAEVGSRFFIEGKVSGIGDGDSVFITRHVGTTYQLRAPDLNGSSASLLRSLSLQSIAQKSGGHLSAGQLLAFDPASRSQFVPVEQYDQVVLTNCPKAMMKVGSYIDLCAWPCGARTVEGNGNKATMLRFDYGVKFSGNLADYDFFLQVSPSGATVRVPIKAAQKNTRAVTAP